MMRIFVAGVLAVCGVACAQTAAVGPYVPTETFAPLTLPGAVNAYRDSSGAPGPKYWQNRADYVLKATLDTQAHALHGVETITYTNHSPDTLDVLWVNLEQNTYRAESRAKAFSGGGRMRRTAEMQTDGMVLESVEIAAAGKAAPVQAKYVVSDTRLQIVLPQGLKPEGVVRVMVRYHYTVPGVWGGRTSWNMAKQGEIYDIAQWYLRMCVYDDVRGWDTQPYLANEFYLEYGDFDYSVTVPGNFVVAGSGELVNEREVLPADELKRLAQARASDKTVMIRTAADVDAALADTSAKTKTWHFKMRSTRDVSFAASPAFLWDAARMNIVAGAGKPAHAALAQSVYPIEATGPDGWGRSTEFIKDAVENFSRRWYPYPYQNAINVAGPTEGMEYPGIVFDGPEERGEVLFFVGAHEIGHTWFPMIVGSNERRDAWIDEGFNTFLDTLESDDFNHGEYGPKRDGEYAPDKETAPADQIAKVIADPEAPVILTRADAIREKYRHPVTYFKSAFGLTLLREDILGPERFDRAFRKFIADWAFKHPKPSDFFREMESEGGEDLSYFWRGWYFNNWQMDMAVTAVTWCGTGPVSVTVANNGKLVLPSVLRVELEGGGHVDVAVPAETWMQNGTHTFSVPVTGTPVRVVLDPEHRVPDAERGNDAMDVQAQKCIQLSHGSPQS
jgi:hypothetical protein